jgi:hypothetical protein
VLASKNERAVKNIFKNEFKRILFADLHSRVATLKPIPSDTPLGEHGQRTCTPFF